eukprot:2481586-Rhodomonas_salina.4
MASMSVLLLAVCTLLCAGSGVRSSASIEAGSCQSPSPLAPAESSPLFISSPQLAPSVQAKSPKV